MSQKLSLLERLFFKSSVSRSAFICALRSWTPCQLVCSMLLTATGSNWKAAKMRNCGFGKSLLASIKASSTCVGGIGSCSGPKETTARADVAVMSCLGIVQAHLGIALVTGELLPDRIPHVPPRRRAPRRVPRNLLAERVVVVPLHPGQRA